VTVDERTELQRESLIEDAVDGIVQAIWNEAAELDGPTQELAELIARRVAERFGLDA
jgi:hypothetical protein